MRFSLVFQSVMLLGVSLAGLLVVLLFLQQHLVKEARRAERLADVRRLISSANMTSASSASGGPSWVRACAAVGVRVLRSGLLSAKTLNELKQTLSSVSLLGASPLAVFVGAKVILIACGVTIGWLLFRITYPGTLWHLVLPLIAPVAGMLCPDAMVRNMRKGYIKQVGSGMADALDMLVICAEAGLPLEAAIGRVAKEMVKVNKSVANEFRLMAQDMLVNADRREVFRNFGRRTNLSSARRIATAMNQTVIAGSSVTQALRVLATEMRQDRITEYEARAAQLPVLLTLPMILFILPVVFIVAIGPAVITIGRTFTH